MSSSIGAVVLGRQTSRAEAGRAEALLEGVAHGVEIVGRAGHQMLLGIAFDILAAGLDHRLEHLVGAGGRGRVDDLADPVEQKADAVGLAEGAAGLGEGGADFARGAVAVVGQGLDDDRGAARPVALVAHLVIGRVGLAAGAAADRAVDRVLGHVGLARGQHRGAQPRVRRRVGQPGARRGRQFPDDLGKDLGALFVLRALPVHDVFELRMASHRSPRGSPWPGVQLELLLIRVHDRANNPIWQDCGAPTGARSIPPSPCRGLRRSLKTC